MINWFSLNRSSYNDNEIIVFCKTATDCFHRLLHSQNGLKSKYWVGLLQSIDPDQYRDLTINKSMWSMQTLISIIIFRMMTYPKCSAILNFQIAKISLRQDDEEMYRVSVTAFSWYCIIYIEGPWIVSNWICVLADSEIGKYTDSLDNHMLNIASQPHLWFTTNNSLLIKAAETLCVVYLCCSPFACDTYLIILSNMTKNKLPTTINNTNGKIKFHQSYGRQYGRSDLCEWTLPINQCSAVSPFLCWCVLLNVKQELGLW